MGNQKSSPKSKTGKQKSRSKSVRAKPKPSKGCVKKKIDLANWMGNLDDSKRDTSINFLAIPG